VAGGEGECGDGVAGWLVRVAENHGFDGDWRLESLLTMEACLSRREDRVVL